MNTCGRILLTSAACLMLAHDNAGARVEKVNVEFNPYAGAFIADEALGYTERVAPLVGARLGVALSPRVALEAQGGWTRFEIAGTSGLESRDIGLASGALSVDLTGGARVRPFLTVGGGFIEDMTTDAAGALAEPFAEVGGGLKFVGGNGLGISLEARQIMVPVEATGGTEVLQNTAVGARLVLPFGRKYSDSDGDGVADNRDLCLSTPAGASVSGEGCPTDSDADGVWDGLDNCATTPTGATVDVAGCPTDADADGVYDGVDVCMATPAGAIVDATGCPTDADGDGVVDGFDDCPDTQVGVEVDARGCAVVVSKLEFEMLDTGRLRLQGVKFATGSAELDVSSYGILDEAGGVLSRWPQLRIEIGGHTDSRGAVEANRVLSERRAQAVADYVLWRFPQISSNQLRVKGYGEEQPIASNNAEDGRLLNRRVELTVMNREELRQIRDAKDKK